MNDLGGVLLFAEIVVSWMDALVPSVRCLGVTVGVCRQLHTKHYDGPPALWVFALSQICVHNLCFNVAADPPQHLRNDDGRLSETAEQLLTILLFFGSSLFVSSMINHQAASQSPCIRSAQ